MNEILKNVQGETATQLPSTQLKDNSFVIETNTVSEEADTKCTGYNDAISGK